MLTNMTEAEWDAVINVHLKGTFAPMHHAAAWWKARHKDGQTDQAARIINTTSVSGLFGNVGQTNYGAAKAGIAAMTIIAARELQRYDVTVNAISPHAQTRMTEGLRARSEEEMAVRHPRWIAPVVVWLASRQSSHVTARVIEAGAGEFLQRGLQYVLATGLALVGAQRRARPAGGFAGFAICLRHVRILTD
jgi:NAD(P)-dependent dehydrogenase (short-subunit alcohol dehydrogenase family)